MRATLAVAACFWVVLAIAACSLWTTLAPSPEPPATSYFDQLAANATEDFALALPMQVSAAALLRSRPAAIIRYPNSIAKVSGGLPIVVPPEAGPVAGQPFRLGWTTRPTARFPYARTALLASTNKPPVEPPEIPGGLGAVLQVPPDYVLVPGVAPWLTSHEDGHLELNITFVPELAGLRLWVQLVVEDARTPAGVTVTPMVELVVGAQ